MKLSNNTFSDGGNSRSNKSKSPENDYKKIFCTGLEDDCKSENFAIEHLSNKTVETDIDIYLCQYRILFSTCF